MAVTLNVGLLPTEIFVLCELERVLEAVAGPGVELVLSPATDLQIATQMTAILSV